METAEVNNVLAFSREKDDNRVVGIMNLTANPIKETVKADGVEGEYKILIKL